MIKVRAYVGSNNPVKQAAIKDAIASTCECKPEEVQVIPVKTESGVPDQPIGMKETLQGAQNRMQACVKEYHHHGSENVLSFAAGIENGIVADKQLTHWNDIGVVALMNLQTGSTYFSSAEPLSIPGHAGLKAPVHLDQKDVDLTEYSEFIKPFIHCGEDLYQVFSQSETCSTRQSRLQAAAEHTLQRLNNIKSYADLTKEKRPANTVILFGTFDLLHQQHQRLIQSAYTLGKKIIIYVTDKNSKLKEGQSVKLFEHANRRFYKTSQQAAHLLPYGSGLEVRRKKRKHLIELKAALDEFQPQGEVLVFGGEDQFVDFNGLLDLCLERKVPIVAIDRGDGEQKLCSSDLRRKYEYQKRADRLGVEAEAAKPGFWKQKLNSVKDAKQYFIQQPLIGLGAELWRYDPIKALDQRVTSPQEDRQHERVVCCLPGRKIMSLARVRKVLKTQKQLFNESSAEKINDVDYYLLSYEEDKKPTAYHIQRLADDPGYFSDDAMLAVRLILLPKIMKHHELRQKENGLWLVSGEMYDQEQVLSHLLKVTFFARSRGSIMAQEIENAAQFCLEQLGVGKHQIPMLLKAVTVLNISNLSAINRARLFTTVSITGVNDKKAEQCIPDFSALKNGVDFQDGGMGLINHESGTHCAILASIPQSIETVDIYGEARTLTIRDEDAHYTPLFMAPRCGHADNQIPGLIRQFLGLMVMRRECFDVNIVPTLIESASSFKFLPQYKTNL